MIQTNLTNANLQSANLQFVDFLLSILEGSNFRDANLRGVQNIESAKFDENTILPNGEKWYEGYDLTRFTNSNHKEFWEKKWIEEMEPFRPRWYREQDELASSDTD